jgi:hypothetical protein
MTESCIDTPSDIVQAARDIFSNLAKKGCGCRNYRFSIGRNKRDMSGFI